MRGINNEILMLVLFSRKQLNCEAILVFSQMLFILLILLSNSAKKIIKCLNTAS